MTAVILDASVFAALFLPEEQSKDAALFFEKSLSDDKSLFHVPSLFVYEIYAILLKHGDYSQDVYAKVGDFIKKNLEVMDLTDELIQQAMAVSEKGHSKSGYPSFYDAAYHALAVQMGGIFLTSDHRHYAKAKDFGHICLLENWRDIFK